MKTKKLRFLALLLSVLLMASMLPPSTFADEPADELTQETIDRVYDEVLTGEITSTEDVLRVALAQYEARQTTTYGMRSGDNPDENENELPTISQVIESSTDEDGVTTVLIADSTLVVTDDDTVIGKYYLRQSKILDAYSIAAVHTAYFYYKTATNGLYDTVKEAKLSHMATTLYYNSSFSATKLEHYYILDNNGIVDNEEGTLVASFNNPAERTYSTTVGCAEWEDLRPTTSDAVPGFATRAIIYYGATALPITLVIKLEGGALYPSGTWS